MFKPEWSASVGYVIGKGLKDGEYLYALDPAVKKDLGELKAAGINSVELDVFGMHYAWAFEKLLKSSLREVTKAGVTLNSVHYPFGVTWMDLASPWEADRLEIVKWIGKQIRTVDEFRPRAHVFHPGGDGIKACDADEYMTKLCDSVNRLADLTDAYVCIEIMVGGELFNTVDKAEKLLERVPKANIVLDVNHLLHDKPEEAVLRLGDRIKTLHISDYDFVYERHLMPLEGKINWNAVISALEKTGYDGRFNYELDMKKYGYNYKQISEKYEKLFSDYNKSRA